MNKVGILATLQARTGKEGGGGRVLAISRPTGRGRNWDDNVGSRSKSRPQRSAYSIPSRMRDGRNAHVNGEIAKALFARAEELFVAHPEIKPVDIVAEKL